MVPQKTIGFGENVDFESFFVDFSIYGNVGVCKYDINMYTTILDNQQYDYIS